MPATDLETLPVASQTFCIRFAWDSSNELRYYTNWSEDITLDGDTYLSTPDIVFSPPEKTIGVDNEEWKLTLPVSVEPADQLALPYPHAPVTCTVERVNPMDTTERFVEAHGVVHGNVEWRYGSPVVDIAFASVKELLERNVGLRATTTCFHRFGDAHCGIDREALKEDATIDSLNYDDDPYAIEVTFDGSPTTTANLWRFGSVRYKGLEIEIAEIEFGTPDVIRLSLVPPPSWDGAEVEVLPGCARTANVCDTVYSNINGQGGEGGFLAPGYAITRNPLFEK